jgi:hypothetical protein
MSTALRFTRRFGRRIVDPEKLLLKQYSLDKSERVDLITRGLVLTQLAIPIGSAIYFILFQTRLAWSYPKQNMSLGTLYWADLWDRLPIHLQNLFHEHWFGTSQEAPAWWVTARHDFRHVLIGLIAALLIGSITVGLKKRKRASVPHMVLSIPAAFIVAMVVASGLIVFFNWATPFMNDIGSSSGNPYVNDLIGKGTIQITLIGVVAGLVAKKLVLVRTFDTLQLMSLEQKLSDGKTEQWWWKYVYAPNYRNRFQYLQACDHEPQSPARWLGFVLSACAPILLFLLGFGIWLLYFGPAAHAH